MIWTKDFVLVSLFIVTAGALQVDIMPAQGEISVGEGKFFLCEVVGGSKEIDWFSPSGEKIEPNRPDITVTRSDEATSTLTIYNAKLDDAGTYKCMARRGNDEGEATVNVKIYQKITFKHVPTPQEFNEGDDAIIVCDVVSSPPPHIIWKHKGTKIQMEKDVRFKVLTNNHLQIRGIKKTDEGTYTCEARIMARGEIDLRPIRVVVNVLPTIRIRHVEVNTTGEAGHSAMLACDADGFPEPIVTWTRSSVLLEEGEKYSFTDDGSEMTIREVRKLDEGEYTCIASNKAGQSEQELSLRVFVKPKITFLENQTTTEMEEQITLTCDATGDPTPTITWSFGNRVFSEGEQEPPNWIYQASWTRPEQHKSSDGNVVVRSDARVSSLTLKYAQYTDAGQYVCTARNAIGHDAQAMYLEVRYAPKLLGSVTVYTWEGNPANISCEILAHPSDVSLYWLRDGIQLPSPNTTNIKIYNTPAATFLEVTPESQNDFGSYNCTASNEIGTESKEFILVQAEVPSSPSIDVVEPYSSTALVEFQEPESAGGVPVLKYRAEWRVEGIKDGKWAQRVYDAKEAGVSTITITGLKPETHYEVRMSAINGKGEGESSLPTVFKTEPVREPNTPKLKGILQPQGNTFKVTWIKQDDGGSPITHYLVRYKPKKSSEWKQEMRMPGGSEYALLNGLDWDTDYDVLVVAENIQGKSPPGNLSFRTSAEPAATPDSLGDGSNLNTGVIVGILIVVFVLLLVAVDITCYFLNRCGLLMCIAVNFCGKSGPGSKGKDIEQGKAAYIKDDSNQPIVEMRTEEETTANHDAGGHTEPNETTPLTEPEQQADPAAAALDLPLSVATNSDTFDTSQNSPTSESTTLTSAPPSESTPAPKPQAPAPPAPAPATPPPSSATPPAKVRPLVELGGSAPSTPPIAPPRVKSRTSSASGTPPSATKRVAPATPPVQARAPGTNPPAGTEPPPQEKSATDQPPRDSAAPPDPQSNQKSVSDEKSKLMAEDANVKTAPAPADPPTAPATQANSTESRA
ncbi:neural cell adhesion molecule 1b isoform X3 [Alosa sapidissima]|uniref:neural cell adhesion molecule 1b isoform X3 n=1 Tax=Alosa sapidissima TaxID=34773 RepID=UPI001C0A0415|nr:neural cell adhesion molecule 1b isoform X3 [Alosa sapidissima]